MKRVYPLFCCAAFLGLAPPALALTASGSLGSDTLWTSADSPVEIPSDLVVPDGTTLTIEPGVTIELAKAASLVVQGQLIAIGSPDDPIVFTGAGEGDSKVRWKSLVFEETAVDATFQNVDEYVSGSILSDCRFEMATKAVVLLGASPYVFSCEFIGNKTEMQIDTKGGAALNISAGSIARIRECLFDGNTAAGFAYGGAIYVEESNPIIQDNIFTNNAAIYGGALCTNLVASPIVGNLFQSNSASGATTSEGGAASLISTVAAFLNNEVLSNTSVTDGGGLHVCVDCHPHATPFILDNTFEDNVMEADDAAHGAAGVGAAFLRMFADNNLIGNLRAGRPADFGWYHPLEEGFPLWASTAQIGGNWWGTSNPTVIEQSVTDGRQVPGVGVVEFGQPLTGPVESATPRVTLTTRRLRYEDALEPMPLFLTIYNPGPQATYELRILVQYDDGPAFPLNLPLDYPGATAHLGGWLLPTPENSVFFAALTAPPYQPETQRFKNARFHAALYDPATGQLVGRVCSIQTDFVAEVMP